MTQADEYACRLDPLATPIIPCQLNSLRISNRFTNPWSMLAKPWRSFNDHYQFYDSHTHTQIRLEAQPQLQVSVPSRLRQVVRQQH